MTHAAHPFRSRLLRKPHLLRKSSVLTAANRLVLKIRSARTAGSRWRKRSSAQTVGNRSVPHPISARIVHPGFMMRYFVRTAENHQALMLPSAKTAALLSMQQHRSRNRKRKKRKRSRITVVPIRKRLRKVLFLQASVFSLQRHASLYLYLSVGAPGVLPTMPCM